VSLCENKQDIKYGKCGIHFVTVNTRKHLPWMQYQMKVKTL